MKEYIVKAEPGDLVFTFKTGTTIDTTMYQKSKGYLIGKCLEENNKEGNDVYQGLRFSLYTNDKESKLVGYISDISSRFVSNGLVLDKEKVKPIYLNQQSEILRYFRSVIKNEYIAYNFDKHTPSEYKLSKNVILPDNCNGAFIDGIGEFKGMTLWFDNDENLLGVSSKNEGFVKKSFEDLKLPISLFAIVNVQCGNCLEFH